MGKSTVCLNCSDIFGSEKTFCPTCGQKKTRKLLSVWALLTALFQNIINLDSKFYNSFKKIWIPGKLSEDYVAGRRQRNLSMPRLFFAVLVFHIAVLAYSLKNVDISNINEEMVLSLEKSKLLETFEENKSEIAHVFIDSSGVDTIRSVLFQNYKHLDQDTINMSFFNLQLREKGITKQDILEKTPEEIATKLGVDDFLSKITIKQFKKFVKEPNSIIKTVVGNTLWIAILVVFICGLFLKLLYIRNNVYLVEHVSILIHFQIFAWLIISSVLIINMLRGEYEFDGFLLAAVIVSILYLYLSMLRYYKQGWFKTVIKFGLLGFMYINVIILATVFVGAVSFFLF